MLTFISAYSSKMCCEDKSALLIYIYVHVRIDIILISLFHLARKKIREYVLRI